MSWSERTACRKTTTGGPVTSAPFALSAAVNPGDVVVVAVVSNTAATITASGLGATWVALTEETTAPHLKLFVGYGIPSTTSGNITLTFSSNTFFAVVATAFTGLLDAAGVVGSTGHNTIPTGNTTDTPAVTVAAGGAIIGTSSRSDQTATSNDINAPTWSTGETNTHIGETSQGAAGAWRVVSLDVMAAAAAETTHATYTSTDNVAGSVFNTGIAELIVLFGAGGALTLGGTVGGSARPTTGGALTLGGSTVAPVITQGSLTLGSPAAEARPVYLAVFTVDVGQESSDIPDVAPAAPTVDYAGDDDSDLIDYPDPTLDEWGRPIAS